MPPKRKHLRVYVRMIMTMLRMQKGAKEKKIQRQKQDGDLPDPEDIELFADFDEGADSASLKLLQLETRALLTPSTRGRVASMAWRLAPVARSSAEVETRATHRSPSAQTWSSSGRTR